MQNEPIAGHDPTTYVRLTALDGDGDTGDVGYLCDDLQMKCHVNGGYIVKGTLLDTNFNILKELAIDHGYLADARSRIYEIEFAFRHTPDSEPPEEATPKQRAFVTSVHARGTTARAGRVQFVGVDPPSWYLNSGDASGRAYRGRVSDVIAQVIDDYSVGLTVEVGDSSDSPHNRWWMMRQDPKSFIMSLLDWSSSVSARRTQWMVEVDDKSIRVQEQANLLSSNVALYKYGIDRGFDTIVDWELLSDNALSVISSKLLTQGMSAVSGQYLDRIQDVDESKVFIKDANVPAARYKARINSEQGFTKPPDDKPSLTTGWTSVPAIPEIYSAGDLGKRYEEYIDGRPRALFLNLAPFAMRARFRVVGHGIYISGRGLGADTITLAWMDGDHDPYFMGGNWMIYGFHHISRVGRLWTTDLYCARLDHDANATPKPDR